MPVRSKQMTFLARYVRIGKQEVRVEELFIDFIKTKNKTAEGISDMIVSKLKADGLDIMNCKGQAYDNTATMAGCHTGVQPRMKDINPNAEFVPYSNYSLNLVSVHAPSVEVNSVTFFLYSRTLLLFFPLRQRTDGKFLNPQVNV
ncbi:hypothetical protein TNCV_27221 [Trichonephila clavipes]|uniref:DUF4371 domain-containing protein n=1 Tax=Trichonephila clavipes TaxID=2585209 RepID=A0A8X6WM31_TRICX|nr:hypothetical protein TNCV_27221 [Trichonephila clavipes]